MAEEAEEQGLNIGGPKIDQAKQSREDEEREANEKKSKAQLTRQIENFVQHSQIYLFKTDGQAD